MREYGIFSESAYSFNFHFHTTLAKGGKNMGEISTVQVVLMGLITVFVVLVCLIVIIKLMGAIVAKAAPAKPAAPAASTAAAPAPVPTAAPAGNKQQIVAAIAVAIAEEMGTDVSHIRIHSIKRV